MDTLLQDLKHALRMFRQNSAFTLAAVAALALGIGANTAIFSVVNTVLWKPLPFADAGRLVQFGVQADGGNNIAGSPAKFAHWRSQGGIVEDVAAFRSNVVNLTGGQFPEQLRAAQVSADYFRLFGAQVLQGRTFNREEDLPGGERVAVLSHGFWTRRYGADRSILDKSIDLSGDPHRVIGVLAPGFRFDDLGPPPEVWVPFQLDPNTSDQGHYFTVAGRLKEGVTLDQANAKLAVSGGEYRAKFPDAFSPDQRFFARPLQEALVGGARASLLVLVGAVAFVLLIACANVANLLLARAAGRKREIAIRAAIGAGRGRIIRQLLAESVFLSLAGGALGLVLGAAGIRALLSVNTAGLPRVGDGGAAVGIDWRVLIFTLLVSLAAGVLFGLIPAVQSSRTDLSTALKESSGRTGSGFRQNKARALLVVSEVALALVLLVGSALLIRTAIALYQVDPGFQTANVLTMRMSLTGPRFLQSAGVERFVRTGVERVEAIPGVEAATAACCVPLEGGYGLPFRIVGRPLQNGLFHGGGSWMTASSGYFEAFRIPVRRGRVFNPRDDSSAPPVVVISEAMARQYWPDSDPLQDRLIIGREVMQEFASEPERQIIGVVGDIRDGALNNDPGPKMYIPQAQLPDAVSALNLRITPMAWIVRTRVDPHSLSATVRKELEQVTGLPVSEVKSMEDTVSISTSRQRFNMWAMTVFGAAALLLAAIGIYGLMAYSVQQRTQEIGIRLALGAGTRQVRRMVVFQGMKLAAAGVVIGLASAFGLTRFIAGFLFGVQAWDPLVFAAVPALLSAVAFLAVWLPARRASRVNPIDALRYE